MIARPSLLLVTLGLTLVSFGQEQCTSQQITGRWLQAHGKHIDLAEEVAHVQGSALRGGAIETIPVVVHVVYNTPAENVPTGTITNIINQLNADYQAQNADYGNARPAFLGVRGDAEIAFCLAVMDPDSNATTGITRTSTTQTWFDPSSQTDDMKSAPNGIAPWDPLHYLNIWICDISSGATGGLITAGYAYLPYAGMVGSAIDGVVLDYSYGTGVGNRRATHEVGHYLGLLHPWGDGGCGSMDGIDDTPVTDSPTYSCSNTALMKCSVLTQYENFMDYSNCPMMFTIDQVAVMSGILNGSRSELLNGSGCSDTSGVGIAEPPIDRLSVQRSENTVQVEWRQQTKDQRLLVIDGAGRVAIDATPRNSSFAVRTTDLASGIYEVVVLLDGQRLVARFSVP